MVRKTRPNNVDASDAALTELYRCSSTVPMVDLQRRFKNLLGIWDRLNRGGFPLSFHLGLTAQWRATVRDGPVGPVTQADQAAISSWRGWMLDDPLVHPYGWLRADMVPPSPFFKCDPALTPDASGILSDPSLTDHEFQKVWLPCFSRSVRGHADLCNFAGEVEGWLLFSGI